MVTITIHNLHVVSCRTHTDDALTEEDTALKNQLRWEQCWGHCCYSNYVAKKIFCNILFFPQGFGGVGGFGFFLNSFSSRITYHGPGIGCIKMPLGMDNPLGQ